MAPSLIPHVSQAQLLAHLRRLEGERHPFESPAKLRAAQDYIQAHWRTLGYAVSLDAFSYSGHDAVNLIARPRQLPPGPRLIIGAHVDTVPGTPGADDNASGLAVLLEASRLLAAAPRALPVEFVAFTHEELGMVGSTHYAAALRQAKAPLLGMLSLEMVGFTESEGIQHYPWFLKGRYPSLGNYLGLAANRHSHQLLQDIANAMRTVPDLPVETMILPGNGWVFPESRLSDHAPFWDRGYPALLVTDTSFFRNPHYHQPTDTVETLDLDFLTKVTQGLIALIEAFTDKALNR
jgi:Zn-dependent M28 family amino/carboxypeptidase